VKACASLAVLGSGKRPQLEENRRADYEQRLAPRIAILQQRKFSGLFSDCLGGIIRDRWAEQHSRGAGTRFRAGRAGLFRGLPNIDRSRNEFVEALPYPERVTLPYIDTDFA